MEFSDDEFRVLMSAVGVQLARVETADPMTSDHIMTAVICRDLQHKFFVEAQDRWPEFREALEQGGPEE